MSHPCLKLFSDLKSYARKSVNKVHVCKMNEYKTLAELFNSQYPS